MNVKFPRGLDIDYVRIVIGEGAHTESVKDERVYMLFAGYKDGLDLLLLDIIVNAQLQSIYMIIIPMAL